MTDRDEAAASHIRRFREAALPFLDDVYTFACFLARNRVEAENAVQECFLRGLDRFDTWRGASIKPWLFGILRSICCSDPASHSEDRLKQEPDERSGAPCLIPQNDVSRLVESLPHSLREIIVLRECHRMSCRDIAEVTGMATKDVLTQLAKARAALAAEWRAGQRRVQGPSDPIRQRKCTVF